MKRWCRAGPALMLLAAFGIVTAVAQTPATSGTAASPPSAGTAKAPAPKAAKASKSAKNAANVYKPVIESKAMDLLKATSDRLAAARTMSFTAVAGYEYPSKLGPPIVYSTQYDVTLQRPDKLRILIPGDGPASEYYYDGKTAMAYAPAENLVAINENAPPTIDEALDAAFKNAAIFFPFEDLLVADPYAAMTKGAILAFYIGPSVVIGGAKTEMVAWANNEVFLQIWIGADDKLPRRVRAMYREDSLALRHEVTFSNWRIDPAVSADTFTSVKALSAGRMKFAAPAPPPKGMKPITTIKSGTPAPAKAPAKTN